MSSNFPALNPTKTEFLLIGNRSQIYRANTIILCMPKNVSIRPVSSAHKLGVIFDSELSFSKHSLPLLCLVSIIFKCALDLPTATIAVSNSF